MQSGHRDSPDVLPGLASQNVRHDTLGDTKSRSDLVLRERRLIRVQAANGCSVTIGQPRAVVSSPADRASLLLGRRPPAVLRAIRTIVVDAVEGVLRAGFLPHVFRERAETLPPPLTDRYAAPAVSMEIFVLFIVAACAHAVPGLIQWVPGVAWLDASAGLRIAVAEVAPHADRFPPAVASTEPCGATALGTLALNHDQPAEALPHEFDRIASGSILETPARLAGASTEVVTGVDGFGAASTATKPMVFASGSSKAPENRELPEFLAGEINEFSHEGNIAARALRRAGGGPLL
jgi:hypothetical protein